MREELTLERLSRIKKIIEEIRSLSDRSGASYGCFMKSFTCRHFDSDDIICNLCAELSKDIREEGKREITQDLETIKTYIQDYKTGTKLLTEVYDFINARLKYYKGNENVKEG